MTNLPD